MISEGYLPKSTFSAFLNRYPEALVVKLKFRASVQKQREGGRLMHDFLYRLQKQAHQLKKQGQGGSDLKPEGIRKKATRRYQ
ncbi:hypothetical protein [Vibrio crassostreae]|uniref:hypothetical protein n=1 Tax=Vibrio crassostreae TaxID=246167 RepID=UPI001B30589E|nr:hypothetical protein [Vibrio crassostreae]CAK1937872.1 hypothetical protein VCRA2117O428_260014 [Vibrio crassostreae]CAK1952535.1 hypothetical protein VCRA2114O422_280062 [Vibrio crassostreae]CAK1959011.1 hypothetical protein VCRA2119O431_280062 [Vibrio crassostreae]CAK2330016.1 hypothetical protein VCRA2116O425_280014 [Vibrio crassostreae]CAK2824662.1 hypothetical protein VCRA2126O448_260062 [Vibrio crassostreae]